MASTALAYAHQEYDVEDMQHILEEHDAVAVRVTRLLGRHLVSRVLPFRHGGPVNKMAPRSLQYAALLVHYLLHYLPLIASESNGK